MAVDENGNPIPDQPDPNTPVDPPVDPANPDPVTPAPIDPPVTPTDPPVEPPAPVSHTVGEFIDKSETDHKTADASAQAAIDADAKAKADQETSAASDVSLVAALKKTGDITVANADGTFSTYTVNTSSAGEILQEKASKGKDTVVPDDVAPAPTS